MKICCTSDLHGFLPEIPDCDLLLIAGDITPLWCERSYQQTIGWFSYDFAHWTSDIVNRLISIIYIAGNHDFVFEKGFKPKYSSCRYLQDESFRIKRKNIYGTPWQKRFGNYAFNLNEEELAKKWKLIPDNTDILVCHSPPHLYGDIVHYMEDGKEVFEHTGSPSLLSRIIEVKPKLVVCGHIHCAYGKYNLDDTIIVNASHTIIYKNIYVPNNDPIIVEI